jgi:hypothetical protein
VRSCERRCLLRCSRILLVRIRFSADLTFGKTASRSFVRYGKRVGASTELPNYTPRRRLSSVLP